MKAPTSVGPPAVSDLVLERYRLGELPAGRRAALEERLRTDTALRARLEAIDDSDERARRRYEPEEIARDVRRRLGVERASRSRSRTRAVWLLPAMGVILLAVAVSPSWLRPWSSQPRPEAPGASVDRRKGADLSLLVYRSTGEGVERLTDDDVARAGDVVRLGYRVANPAYGAIVSIDGRGAVTRHLPEEGSRAVRLEPGATALLGGAFELDDAPAVERFFLIASPEPFDLGPVIDALRAAAGADATDPAQFGLPASFASTAFSLRKDSRP